MNFCEDSSSGLKAKRRELLAACLHRRHHTHSMGRIPACSRDGQDASATSRLLSRPPASTGSPHGRGGARSLRHIPGGKGSSSPPQAPQRNMLGRHGSHHRHTASRLRGDGSVPPQHGALGVTYWTPGRSALAASRRAPLEPSATACTSPEQRPCRGLQAVTRGYWRSSGKDEPSHTHTHSHTLTHTLPAAPAAPGPRTGTPGAPGHAPTAGPGPRKGWRQSHTPLESPSCSGPRQKAKVEKGQQ